MRVVTLDEDAGRAQPLFVDFVNTLHWYEGEPIELIGNPADLAAWLAEQGLPSYAVDGLPSFAADSLPSFAAHGLPAAALDASVPALHALREHARAATEALARAQTPSPGDLAALNAALRAPAGHLILLDPAATPPAAAPPELNTAPPDHAAARPQLALELDGDDAALAAFRIALSFARFFESAERHRLKLCANPGCGFAFLDTSTNGTRRWCYMRYCGNRLKARAFRRRRAGSDVIESA